MFVSLKRFKISISLFPCPSLDLSIFLFLRHSKLLWQLYLDMTIKANFVLFDRFPAALHNHSIIILI